MSGKGKGTPKKSTKSNENKKEVAIVKVKRHQVYGIPGDRVPTTSVKRLCLKAGILRLQCGTLKHLAVITQNHLEDFCKGASIYAQHSRRVTVQKQDFKLAYKTMTGKTLLD